MTAFSSPRNHDLRASGCWRRLNHREPDRVPIDLGGNQTGIHKFAYQALLEHLGIDEDEPDDHGRRAATWPGRARRCSSGSTSTRDTSPPGAAADFDGGIVQRERDGRLWHDLTDEFGVVWSMPDDQPLYMDITHHPLADATLDDIARLSLPQGRRSGPVRRASRAGARRSASETPYAVVSGISGVVYEICWYLRGLEQWFMDMLTQPEFCEALLDQTLQFWLDWFRLFLDEVGDLVDVIMIGDDLAGQNGPLFRPDFYRRVVKPRQKRLVAVHPLADDGEDLVSHLRRVRRVHPRPARQRRRHPQPGADQRGGHGPGGAEGAIRRPDWSFWGGAIDAQHVLPSASPEEVREHVRRNLEIWKPGGGYVFNNVHNIQAGVPPENIVALYDAAYEFGFYDAG